MKCKQEKSPKTYHRQECSGWDMEKNRVADNHVEDPSKFPSITGDKMDSGIKHNGLAGSLANITQVRPYCKSSTIGEI